MKRFTVKVVGYMVFKVDAESAEIAKAQALDWFWDDYGPQDYVFKVEVEGEEPIPIEEVR